MATWDLSPKLKTGLTSKNQFSVIHNANKTKSENCMIISMDAEKVFYKIQHKHIVTPNKLGIEGNFLRLVKNIYENKNKIILHGE